MAVRTGWVGSSAKEETGKAWMSPARLELRLPKAGWMSEMVGRSVEIVMRTVRDTANMDIYTYFGRPTQAAPYVLYIDHLMSSNSSGSPAMTTGVFPAGSTLKIINLGHIRGAGGAGGAGRAGYAGGTALTLNFPTTIDNVAGTIWGGGGGGGGYRDIYGVVGRGGGGAGVVAGTGFAKGTATSGGAGQRHPASTGGTGGAPGSAGAAGWHPNQYGVTAYGGGRGGYSMQRNGHAVTWIAVGDRRGSVV